MASSRATAVGRTSRPGVSSSVMVSVTGPGAFTPWPPVAVAETGTGWSGPCTALSTAVSVTRPVLVVCSGAIVSVVPLCVYTAGSAGVVTVRVTAWLDLPESMAVTVATSPFSAMAGGVTASVTVGRSSSSGVVTATLSFSRPS